MIRLSPSWFCLHLSPVIPGNCHRPTLPIPSIDTSLFYLIPNKTCHRIAVTCHHVTVTRHCVAVTCHHIIITCRHATIEIPGCPSPHHESFLSQLTDVLSKEMAASGGQLPIEIASDANMTLEEKSVRWKFMSADRDNDEVSGTNSIYVYTLLWLLELMRLRMLNPTGCFLRLLLLSSLVAR